MIVPIEFQWDGESMVAAKRFQRLCDKQFVIGEVYRLAPHEERSQASHNQFFAAVTDAWRNLPEDIADQFASPEHLRKFALIKAGYRDERSIVCASQTEARRMAAFIKPMDEFAVVICRGTLVTVYTAKSQSFRAMGKAEFQQSKDAVLGVLANMIGVDQPTLQREAGRAA